MAVEMQLQQHTPRLAQKETYIRLRSLHSGSQLAAFTSSKCCNNSVTNPFSSCFVASLPVCSASHSVLLPLSSISPFLSSISPFLLYRAISLLYLAISLLSSHGGLVSTFSHACKAAPHTRSHRKNLKKRRAMLTLPASPASNTIHDGATPVCRTFSRNSQGHTPAISRGGSQSGRTKAASRLTAKQQSRRTAAKINTATFRTYWMILSPFSRTCSVTCSVTPAVWRNGQLCEWCRASVWLLDVKGR